MTPFILLCLFLIIIIIAIRSKKEHDHSKSDSIQKQTDEPNFDMFKNKESSVYANTTNSNTNLTYYEFDHKYYDSLTKKIDNYSSYCEDTKIFFASNFNISQRITRLEKCIQKLENIKATYYNYGENGIKLFTEITSDVYEECYKNWSNNDIIKNSNGSDYIFEFENIDFCNYNFLVYLLNLYKTDMENQKRHLEQEKIYYKISEGGEEYQQMIEEENYVQSIKQTVIKLIHENKTILQSELINNFIDDDKKYAKKVIDELYKSNEITKEKKGRSYIIKYLDSSTKISKSNSKSETTIIN